MINQLFVMIKKKQKLKIPLKKSELKKKSYWNLFFFFKPFIIFLIFNIIIHHNIIQSFIRFSNLFIIFDYHTNNNSISSNEKYIKFSFTSLKRYLIRYNLNMYLHILYKFITYYILHITYIYINSQFNNKQQIYPSNR